ncbi:MAG: hydantoinase/oxoprolinase family protein, partial [Parafilimonas terrae]|nr:hydantoinase/oxoprolinase family protein [Parafilimonas terrae]
SRRVVGRLAERLGLGLNETAEGILTIINANMANAIRSRTVQKGIDPRGFALVAFGGAGPLHGVEVAAMLGIPEIIVPPFPGITSAMGLLTTDLKYDAVRTQFQTSGSVDLDRLNRDLAGMEASLGAQFEADKIGKDRVGFERTGDLRYVGQGYELRILLPAGTVTEAGLAQVWAAFHKAHAAEYGHAFEASPIELVNVRVSGIGAMPKLTKLKPPAGGTLEAALLRTVPCVFRMDGALATLDTPVYHRPLLPADQAFAGPAIVLQTDSTTVVPPRTQAKVDGSGNIVITLGALR